MQNVRFAAAVLLWITLGLVSSFNLEPRIPVVKKGSAKSHFGYSVAQHQTITHALGRDMKKSWLLVGAPKDHNLQPETNRSGALWKCPVTTYSDDCVQVQTDGLKVNGTLLPPTPDEQKDDQWMGVTVRSQGPGGNVLVCAHRYKHVKQNSEYGYGLCYVLSQNLDVEDVMEPCKGKPVAKEHEQWGYCQAGTSGVILNDEVVLGVPGPYTWRGTVHTSNISDNFLLRDKTQYFGPVTNNMSPVYKYSYLGYSVTAGHFFGNKMSYIGGAPRSNGTGQVVFFSREKLQQSLLLVDLILNGEMFASSYGFEVLAIDFNADGFDDLVVGAPFYFSVRHSGAVYVYINNGNFKDDHPYVKMVGSAGDTRYGFSIAALGDLNRDGFKDVAVGSPYEDKGAVYIYLGSRDGLITTPSQIIRAQDLPGVPSEAFGYALSGGFDLDDNGYPDLLVSSFCSDRILLIRSRPIIDIQTKVQPEYNLQNIDPSIRCRENKTAQEACFSFNACFKMDSHSGTRTNLQLNYTIMERVYQDQPVSRIYFADSPNKANMVQRQIFLSPDKMGKLECSRELVYIRGEAQDVLRPMRFKLFYTIVQKNPRPVTEGERLPDIDDYPILNQQEALRYFEATFAKDCGADDVCKSDLSLRAALDAPVDRVKKHYILELGSSPYTILSASVRNKGEAAYLASLYVTHHDGLFFSPKDSETKNYQCAAMPSRQGVVHCILGNPFMEEIVDIKLAFKPSDQPIVSRFIDFEAMVNSTSTEVTPHDDSVVLRAEVIKRAEISITGSVEPEQVFYGGEIIGESAIEYLDQIGNEVSHKYVIHNGGPWRVNSLKVQIMWPHQVENNQGQGKWLLYMTERPYVNGGSCELDPSYINPLIYRRRSKTFKIPLEQETLTASAPEKNVTLEEKTITVEKTVTSRKTEKETISKTHSKLNKDFTDRRYALVDGDNEDRELNNKFEATQHKYAEKSYDDNIGRLDSKGDPYGKNEGSKHEHERKTFSSQQETKTYSSHTHSSGRSWDDDHSDGITHQNQKKYGYTQSQSRMGSGDEWTVDHEDEYYSEGNGFGTEWPKFTEHHSRGRAHYQDRASSSSSSSSSGTAFYRHNYTRPQEHNYGRNSNFMDSYKKKKYTKEYSDYGGFEESGNYSGLSYDYLGDDGLTYSNIVIDRDSGKPNTYSRVLFEKKAPSSRHRRDISEIRHAYSEVPMFLKRTKREKEVIIEPQAITDANTGKLIQVVNFHCDGAVPTAKCFTFTCNINTLGPNQDASIKLTSRLWNSTFVEDYPRVDHVSIMSRAVLILPSDIIDDQDTSDDQASAQTFAYPDLLEQHPTDEIPLWVIIVSILAGLLLLIIIVVILWKLGFFERKRPDDPVAGNFDKDVSIY